MIALLQVEVQKHLHFEDDDVCQRYRMGETVSGP
jgi:hypothetical protein